MRVSDLVIKSGGLAGDAYKKIAYITSENENFVKSLNDINLQKALEGDESNNILLNKNDVLTIYNNDLQ